jgi:prepilin-type N-terminal cleavage/methylation domain-containing protein
VNRRARGQAGFTMVEVMVALIITAIAVMGLIGLFKSQSSAGAFSRHTTEAAVLAENQIETLRTMGTMPTTTTTGTLTTVDPQGVAGGIFTVNWTETPIAATYAELLITVTWTDDGVSHTLTMQGRRDP